ncbi:ribosomal protein S18 acetylase RimI-like enzyme [Clavibacter sp. B3I6]|uniref:GNAT family N-acetyltransferase n=1 Tax=Clavibacter sp. B3I6 TaxID=3042268 RepID=UPI00277EEB9C|nr:GNAT family N-acetyltransferase [Clavibacter sp. B3I6]MDQ0743137.1 ribosomal protein S18 acetylase RimI-like enzyme [Clavibacter sp. B3I6]
MPDPDDVLRLRPFRPARDAEPLRSWFPDEAAFRLFAGDDAPWPFTPDDAARPGHPAARAWSAVVTPGSEGGRGTDGGPRRGAPDDAVGHVEIVPVTAGADGGVPGARLTRIALAPAVRGRGWGPVLVEAAVRQAAREGARRVGLNVVPGNDAALRAYARAGFVDRGRNPEHPSYVWMSREV